MKKNICLLLAITLLVGLLAGCGSGSSTTEEEQTTTETEVTEAEETTTDVEEEVQTQEEVETSPEGSEEPAEQEETEAEPEDGTDEGEDNTTTDGFTAISYGFPLVEETQTLTYFTTLAAGYSSYIENYSENLAVQEMEELTGVHIEYLCYIPENAQTQFNLLAAAGSLPDIILGATEYYSGGMDTAVEEEILLNLADYLDECPNYSALLEQDSDLKNSLTTDSGNLVGFYAYSDPDVQMPVSNCLMIRGDWLEQVGMDVPTTYDEAYEVLTAFKTELGVETPMIVTSYLDDQSGSFAAGYDITAFFMTSPGIQVPFYVVDGEVKCAIVEDDFVSYIELLQSYISEGLVAADIESYTNENSYQSLVTSGEVGFFWGFGISNLEILNEQVEEGGYFVACPAIRKTDGQTLHFTSTANYQVRSCVSLSTNCSDISLACQWLDCHYTDEVSMLAMYGVEGISYNVDEDGTPHYTEMMTDTSEGVSLDVNRALYCLGIDNVYYGSINTELETYTQTQLDALALINSGNMDDAYVYPSGASTTAEEDEIYSALISDLSTYMAEHVLKFVTGAEDMSEYQTFVDNLYEMGLQDAIDIKQAAYDRYISR